MKTAPMTVDQVMILLHRAHGGRRSGDLMLSPKQYSDLEESMYHYLGTGELVEYEDGNIDRPEEAE